MHICGIERRTAANYLPNAYNAVSIKAMSSSYLPPLVGVLGAAISWHLVPLAL